MSLNLSPFLLPYIFSPSLDADTNADFSYLPPLSPFTHPSLLSFFVEMLFLFPNSPTLSFPTYEYFAFSSPNPFSSICVDVLCIPRASFLFSLFPIPLLLYHSPSLLSFHFPFIHHSTWEYEMLFTITCCHHRYFLSLVCPITDFPFRKSCSWSSISFICVAFQNVTLVNED